MTGQGQIKRAATAEVIPYNQLTVSQTWGREIPTIDFVTKPGISVSDKEALEVYRDGTLIAKCIAELFTANASSRRFTGRLNPTTALFRIVKPARYYTDPAWLLQVLNQPVQDRLYPYRVSVFEKFDYTPRVQANWLCRTPTGSPSTIPLGSPVGGTTGNIFAGLTTENHDQDGVGVICLGRMTADSGAWLSYETAIGHPAGAGAIGLIAKIRVMSDGVSHKVALFMTNNLLAYGQPYVGYMLHVDFDSTSNNLKIYRVPNSTSGNWVVITQASLDLTGEKGKLVTLRFTRRNRNTIAVPNYFFAGTVTLADGTETFFGDVQDNTYAVFYGALGELGNNQAGGGSHIHVDQVAFVGTDQYSGDLSYGLVYPWVITLPGLGVGYGYGSEAFDDIQTVAPTYSRSGGNQALNDKMQIDTAASKSDLCRVDVIGHPSYYAQNAAIEVSLNGTDWTIVWSKTNITAPEIYAVFDPVSARYVRVRITANGTIKWEVQEFRIYQKSQVKLFPLGTITEYGAPVLFDQAWITLWDAIHDISEATGWHVWLNPRTLTINFNSTRGSDLSATIKFEEGRNISTFNYTKTLLDQVDRVWVLGKTLGEEQLYAISDVSPLPSDYRERVFMAKAISDQTILQTLADTLKTILNSPLEIISLDVKDGYASASWDIGDLVNVSIPSRSITGNYRVLNVTRKFMGKSEKVSVDLASPAVMALKVIEFVLAQDAVIAQLFLNRKIQDLELA
jgi:hypothetical protein